MKIGKRLLALVLVLAMMVSNLPMGAIAAELEELAPEPTEALTETEQPTQAAPEETDAPETTEAAPTEAPTTEATTEAATEEATEAATEEATEAATEPVVEELTATEEAVNETLAEEVHEPYLVFRWLSTEYDDEGNIQYYEPEGGADVTNIDMLPTEPFYLVFYLVEWDSEASDWQYTRIPAEELEYNTGYMTIGAIPEDQLSDAADYGYLAAVTPEITAWDTDDYVAYTMEDGTYLTMRSWLGRSPGELYYTDTFNNDTVITRYTIDPDVENVFYYYFDADQGWTQNSFRMTLGSEYVTWEQLDYGNDYLMKYTFTDEAVAEAQANGYLHLEFEAVVYNEEEGTQTWTTPFWVSVKATEETVEPYLSFSPIYGGENGLEVAADANLQSVVNAWGMVTLAVFWLNEYDADSGEWVRTAVEVEPGDDSINLDLVNEAITGADFYYEITTNTANVTSSAVYTMEDGTELSMNIGTWPHNFHFTTEGNTDNSNTGLIYELDLSTMEESDSFEVYAAMFHDDFTWTNVRLSELSENFADMEAVEEGRLYKITIHGNAQEYLFEGSNYVNLEVLSTQTDNNSGDVNEDGYMYMSVYMTPDPYLTYGWLSADENGVYEGGVHDETAFSIVPGDGFCHIYYLHTWDADQGCYVETPVPVEELYCDNDVFTIEAFPADEIRDGEPNADCFALIGASEGDQESEIYTTVDGVRVEGVYIRSSLPQLGFYSSGELSYGTYLRGEFYVDPDAEENAFYVGLYADYWVIDGDPWLDPEGMGDLMSVEKISDTVVKVTLNEEGVNSALHGDFMWPGICFDIVNTVDGNTDSMYAGGLCIKAYDEDIIRDDEGFRMRFLMEEGEGFYDPRDYNAFGTNLYKGDSYPLYFFLNLWSEEEGCYVEIPVEPQYNDGIVMEPVEDVREGEDNSGWYWVSVTEFDTEHEIWVEYEGTTYTMPIYANPHELALYSEPVMSPDTYYNNTLFEIDPFEPFVFYLGSNIDTNEWTITDVYILEGCEDYATIEPVEGTDNFWKIIQTAEGINRNMYQYWLDMGVRATLENVNDSSWVETRGIWFAYSRMELADRQGKAFFEADGQSYEIFDKGYSVGWPTGEYDEWGNEIWDHEVRTHDEWPADFSYDWTTNTLTLDNYTGEWMRFEYECYDWENDSTWYNMPSDTLTVELIGDNSLVAENHHALDIAGGLNVTFTGDGSLLLKTVNDFAQDEEGNARTFNTVHMNGGNLIVEGNASVTVEIAGEGNESCWDGDTYLGDRTGNMTALAMDHGQLYIKDNARLETVIPEGTQRNGSVDVGEENAIWGERFPGGYRGIADTFLLKVMGGTLVTQGLEFSSGYHDDGTYWTNNYAQTGGEVIIQANGWNSVNYDEYEENGLEYNVEYVHTHYEGLTVRSGATAGIWGGSLTVNVEAQQGSTYYEGIAIRGGELTIGGDAEITIEANSESGNLVGVYCEEGTGRLNITGGTLNVNGTAGEGNGRSGIYLDHETVFRMSGGTVNAEYADFMNHGPVHISGGTINIGGLYWYDTMIDDRGIPYAWVTGFLAGGPEFIFDGGTINVDGGHFDAGGMVAMNGGEINITNGSLQVNTAFALNDGVINISNPGSEISEYNGEPAHIWPALWVNSYFSIGGSDIENATPTLNITDHQIPSMAVRVDGTYHQMAGSTVNLTHIGTEKPGIYVATQFDENGEPLYATDEEGNLILNEEGEPIIRSGSFLMNDGVLNIMNPGDWGAELIRAMEADPHSFVQFRGGVTNFDTAQLFWNGETHITEAAVVEVKDTAIFANAGHLVMDDGTLKANEESAVCLGMSEMNGGKMELDNAMILVNSGFHFNNGEILINNTDETINTEAVFTSLAANTYFAIGDPEDPNSNPKLTINHSTSTPAVMVNGTMHLMAGTVDINTYVTGAPAVYLSGPIYDENDAPIKTDGDGNPLGAEFLQNGGVMNITAAEEGNMVGIVAAPDTVFFMNGGTTSLNGTNLVLSGKNFLYDKAVLNVTDAIVRLCEGAEMKIDYGVLNLNNAVKYGDDVPSVFYTEPGTHIQLENGEINIASGTESFDIASELYGTFTQNGGAVNIEAPRIGMVVHDTTNITGGTMNIEVEGKIMDDGVLNAYGLAAELDHNPDAVLTISGGEQFITAPDGGQHDTISYAIRALHMPVEITGGIQHLEGQYVYFGVSEDGTPRLRLAEDRVLYSLEDGTRPELLSYPMDGYCFEMYEDDNIPGDWDTGEGFDFVSKAVITTNKAGTSTTWEVNGGVLTFQSTETIGGMYDYAADAPAPWYWLHDFITIAEMDTHLGYIGSYAFNGLDKLTKLVFLGEAPNFAADAFAVITADAYYPVETDSWTVEKLQDYGGEIAWLLNYESVEVVEILTEKDILFSGEKTTLTAQLYPDLENKPDVVWTMAEGDEAYATLAVKNNVATVTAKTVTEKQIITLYAVAEDGLALPVARTLTIYPKAQSVSIYHGETDVTGEKIKFDLVSADELELTAALNPDDAAEYLVPAVAWTSSSSKIATVDENGVVTFTGTAGTVKITATANDGSKKKAVVTITALEMVQDIEMADGSVEELLGGKSASFTVVDENLTKLKTSQVTWTMDEVFAPYGSITTKGKLTTKVVQEAVQVTIKATLVDNPKVYETHTVTIRPATTVVQIELDGRNVTGDTIPVDIDGYDADNLPTVNLNAAVYPDGTFTDVTWKSSSTSIAKVDANTGEVTGIWKNGAVKTGTVTITATSTDGSKKTASVKLNFGVFTQDVEITSTEKEIVSGQTLTLAAETFPENATKAGVTWSLKNASDKSFLSVTAAGKVKAKTVYGPQEVTLVATSKDGYASDEMTLTVMPKDDSILVIKSGADYVTKTTQTLDLNGDASITLSAHTLNGGQETVTWTPVTSKLGTIVQNDDGTLTVTMTAAGSMSVTAKASDGRKASVTLKAVKLATGVTIKDKASGASEGLTLAAGKTMTLVSTIENAGKAKVTWSVEPSDIATITSAGKLTAAAGLAYEQPVTVTAVADDGSGAEGSVEVLLQPQAQGIQIHGLSGELTNCTVTHDMRAEETIELSARTFPADAADSVTWKSSNQKIAQIDENTGKITCVKPGTVTITATATDGSGKKATFKLTLVKLVSTLVLNETNAVLAGGKSLTLKADAGDATDGSVTWAMTGDTAYATLSAKGVLKASAVTAPKKVYVTATANDGSGVKAYCTVTIYPATTSVQILKDGETVTGKTLEVQAGQTITLEGSSLPVSAADAYEWKSSGTAAAVENGEVTGVTSGKTVTITCTAADGSGKKATVKIKVVPAV